MPTFPSLEWCQALVAVLEKDPNVLPALKEWGGQSVGVVIGKDKGLARDFCIYAKPDKTQPKLAALKVCEDEDDLELEEPDFLFRAPYGLFKQLLERKVDPVDVLMKGQVRVVGDLKRLVTFGHKHRLVGESAIERIQTTFA